ncbi:MAG: acylphosphatase [Candidatus Omnitrophota bacterium]|nr:MAG: acylphosphatase [Candidatus Omnitrophota bacterium]
MQKRIHVYFSGKVQGVGFRFTTEEVARETGIFGWVKNLRDGRVEVVAEGSEKDLKDFLGRVNSHFSNYISDSQVEWMEASHEFNDFRIRF